MSKNKVEVVIGGSIYALQGDESEEHIQNVAKIINEKLGEIQQAYRKSQVNQSKLNTLLTLNLADECVKRQETLESFTTSLEKATIENEQLRETVKDLTLQLAHIQEELAKATHQRKKRM